MILVRYPPGREAEKRYILDVLLGEFLGLKYRLVRGPKGAYVLSLAESPRGKTLRLTDHFLSGPQSHWLKPASLPVLPLETAGSDLAGLPVVFGRRLEGGVWALRGGRGTELGLDIPGSAFFFLSRFEEALPGPRDTHGRFPLESSLSFRAGLFERPIVNEYLDLMYGEMLRLWPRLVRKPRQGRTLLSHDVDHLRMFNPGGSAGSAIRESVQDLRGGRWPKGLARMAWVLGGRRKDPFDTFELLMDQAENRNLRCSFYFLATGPGGKFGPDYAPEDSVVRALLGRILERGHEVGLHAGYQSVDEPFRLAREAARLEAAVPGGGPFKILGGRQHYLRWRNPQTWRAWQDAGLEYDSSLGFPEAPGFRCGVCYEYPVFDLASRKPLALRERPLVAMDGALLRQAGNKPEEIPEKLLALKRRCDIHGGDFTLLWHNSQLWRGSLKRAFRRSLDLLVFP